MSLNIVRGHVRNPIGIKKLIDALNEYDQYQDITGTLFLGYPLSATTEFITTVDALLISKSHGLVAFLLGSDIEQFEEEQDSLFFQIVNTLTNYETLRKGRYLVIDPVVITFFDTTTPRGRHDDAYKTCNSESLKSELDNLNAPSEDIFKLLNEALQKIGKMKPRKKRDNVKKPSSYGTKIKKIEKEIANLDRWQQQAAFEIAGGPQRIRGLAGSGKTVVLALKAAYFHMLHPDWNIAVTFYTRSLSQQFRELISTFALDFMKEIPNWERIQILHAWGTTSEPGVYSRVADSIGVTPKSYNIAKATYGKNSFEGICTELVEAMDKKPFQQWDAVLIDEAQDLPASFFKLCYRATTDPKRIVFAYDELQNLSSNNIPTIEEMFGKSDEDIPVVNFTTGQGEASRDIILPVCYRNTPWTLSLAHALGFGIYRSSGLVQMFQDLEIWRDIGYRVSSGSLQYNENVVLERSSTSYPEYFDHLISREEAIQVKSFSTQAEQYEKVAAEIKKNLTEDELDPDDILVIFPDAYYAKRQYMDLRDYLSDNGIKSFLAGVSSDRDTFHLANHITCSSIYRAKGNEAPIVYILNAEFCAAGTEMITLRNTLFTAITRSRAWVRIYGINPEMRTLEEEIQKCIAENYLLRFRIPTQEELTRIRIAYRERTSTEKIVAKRVSGQLREILRLIESDELDVDMVPEIIPLLQTLHLREKTDEYNE